VADGLPGFYSNVGKTEQQVNEGSVLNLECVKKRQSWDWRLQIELDSLPRFRDGEGESLPAEAEFGRHLLP